MPVSTWMKISWLRFDLAKMKMMVAGVGKIIKEQSNIYTYLRQYLKTVSQCYSASWFFVVFFFPIVWVIMMVNGKCILSSSLTASAKEELGDWLQQSATVLLSRFAPQWLAGCFPITPTSHFWPPNLYRTSFSNHKSIDVCLEEAMSHKSGQWKWKGENVGENSLMEGFVGRTSMYKHQINSGWCSQKHALSACSCAWRERKTGSGGVCHSGRHPWEWRGNSDRPCERWELWFCCQNGLCSPGWRMLPEEDECCVPGPGKTAMVCDP